jgi:hypothetical protein
MPIYEVKLMLSIWLLFCSLHISTVFRSGRIFVFVCFRFYYEVSRVRFTSGHRIVLRSDVMIRSATLHFRFFERFLTILCL